MEIEKRLGIFGWGVVAPKSPADDGLPGFIDGVHLENVLGQVEADGGNLHLGRLLSFVASHDDHVLAR